MNPPETPPPSLLDDPILVFAAVGLFVFNIVGYTASMLLVPWIQNRTKAKSIGGELLDEIRKIRYSLDRVSKLDSDELTPRAFCVLRDGKDAPLCQNQNALEKAIETALERVMLRGTGGSGLRGGGGVKSDPNGS